ncbi:MAG: alpha/beta hydrolase [Hyphomonadaceae bacterium]|nr:alpha/beta hydrolase [Hyphomonadaceae bacterium]
MDHALPGFQHQKAFSNGLMHHVVVGGNGPALLLVHGWMGSWYHWRKVMPLLAAQHTVIAVDARGYGESDKPYDGYDGRTLVADLRGILKGLNISRAFVAGHDMGALPALLLAADHPDEVTGLIYIDEPLPGYNLDRFTAFTKENPFIYWWFAFNSQPHLPALMWEGKEDVLVDYFLTAMAANPAAITAADKAEYVRCLRKPGGLHGSFGWYRDALKTADQIVAATRSKLKTPVLALNGQFGHPGVLEQMHLVAETVSGETIPFCGHLLAEEQPEATARAILAFTAQHAA